MQHWLTKQNKDIKNKAGIETEFIGEKALKNVDLEGTIYVYSSKDNRVGGLSNEELDFLKQPGSSF